MLWSAGPMQSFTLLARSLLSLLGSTLIMKSAPSSLALLSLPSSISKAIYYHKIKYGYSEAVRLCNQRVGLTIRWYQVPVLFWPLAGFVLSCSEFKSSPKLLNNHLVASCQLGVFILLSSSLLDYINLFLNIWVECLKLFLLFILFYFIILPHRINYK